MNYLQVVQVIVRTPGGSRFNQPEQFKSFWSAQKLIACIKTMHMIKKGQHLCPTGQPMSAADQFYSLAI